MKNYKSTRSILSITFVAVAVCVGAWSQNVQVVTEPAAPSGQVTTITQTTPVTPPTQEVTVVKKATKTVHIRHEALMDATGNIVDSIIVKTAPPEPKEEVMSIETRPAENAVWVPGYWQWNADNANYDWVPGTWRRAIPGMTWNIGHWNKVSNGYEWSPGFWTGESGAPAATETTTTRTVVIRDAPPALKEESRPASPGADMVWIPGSWANEKGEYVWSSGRWERPATANMIWSPIHWVHASEGYESVKGHWDYPAESRTYVISTERSDKDRDRSDRERSEKH